MSFYTHPFFWALIAMTGLQGASLIVRGNRLGRNLLFVTLMLTLVTAGRFLLPLPFCPQPRFDLAGGNRILGGLVLFAALVFILPTITVKWWRAPRAGMKLHTRGVYAIVRHPMYLGELLWPLGWSLYWGSSYGVALTPVWWLGFLVHISTEEERLRRELGDEYALYVQEVPGRLLPRWPRRRNG